MRSYKHRVVPTAALAVILSITAAGAPSARAQEQAPAADQYLEEVVVTAQRREEGLQEVPISISAFSAEQLDAANIIDSMDLEHVTPNLIFGESGRDGQIFIRGVGSTRLSGAGADPSSSTYIDGVYRSRGTSALIELLDIQRVEVLRGPQGTLYGRNSTGGAVRYITEDPGLGFGGRFMADVGDYSHWRGLAQIDVPLAGETLRMRATALHSEHDGYMVNLQHPGETFGRKDLNAGRITLKYTPGDHFDLTVHAGTSRDDSDQTALKHFVDPLGFFGSAEYIADPRTVRADYGPREAPIDNSYADATAIWDLGSLVFTSITGWNDLDVGPYTGDLDVTEIAGITDGFGGLPNGIADGGTTLTQEFTLASATDGPLDWVAGIYYLHDDNYTVRQGLYIPLVPALAANHRTFDAFGKTTSYAAFANANYSINDRLRVNAGIRYSWEEKKIQRTQFVNRIATRGPENDEESWNDWTPRVGLDWFVDDDVMLYLSYSEGFKSGAFNASSFDPAVNPEYLDAWEIGAKTSWHDRRLVLNAAAFTYDYQDLQVQGLDPDNIGTEIVRNAAGADIQGAELEATWLVTEPLVVNLGLAFLDAEYTDFPTLAGNLAGNKLPNAPEWTANLGAQYTIALANSGEIRLSGNYFASAERYLSEVNNRFNTYQPAYEVLDLRATWFSANGQIDISLYGKNLTDEVIFSRTVTQALLLRTGYLAYIEPPRTWGVEINFRY